MKPENCVLSTICTVWRPAWTTFWSMFGDFTTSNVKPTRQNDPVAGSVTFVPAGCGVKRYCPKTGSMSVIANVMPAQDDPACPCPWPRAANTRDRRRCRPRTPRAAPQDGMSVMPGSPAGHGKASPLLQTVFVSAVLQRRVEVAHLDRRRHARLADRHERRERRRGARADAGCGDRRSEHDSSRTPAARRAGRAGFVALTRRSSTVVLPVRRPPASGRTTSNSPAVIGTARGICTLLERASSGWTRQRPGYGRCHAPRMAAWAAATRATGTRNGEQET